MASYGINYRGSKDKIVHKIASLLPIRENFYDLFGGGFSVSHYMLLHRPYKHFYFNELQPGNIDLIQDAIDGKYNYNVFKPEWVTREMFAARKDICPYTRIIWSFGNNQKDYLFGKEIEDYKRSLHQAVIFGSFDNAAVEILGFAKWPGHMSLRGRRMLCCATTRKKFCSVKDDPQARLLQQLLQLERLQQLERLERLQQLERLERLTMTSLSYEQVPIKPNSIIYCDPPYKGTRGYVSEFDHEKFWHWVRTNPNPVFVSEYTAPPDMKVLMAIRHKKSSAAIVGTDSVERLYGNEAATTLR